MNITCTPSEAYTETVKHPAVGEPTILVENPDYVPATDGYFTEEVNPDYVPATDGYFTTEANPDYIPATDPVTTLTGFMKWNWTKQGKHGSPDGPPPGGGWHQVGITNDSKGNTPDVIHKGNGKGSYFYYESVYETTPGTPAQGEPTIEVWHEGTPAVGEPTVQVWIEGTPAQGTPLVEVENPEYQAAWTEYVEHEAISCPVEPAPVPEQVKPVAQAVQVPAQPQEALALTGGGDFTGIALMAALALAAGATLIRKARVTQ